MNYFTIKWWSGEVEDDDVFKKYQSHMESIKSNLPTNIIDFYENISLHDGNIYNLNNQNSIITVKLSALQSPDRYWLNLKYIGVSKLEFTSDPDDGLPGPNGFGDIGYDEWHLFDQKIQHCILFNTGVCMTVTFDSFEYSTNEHA